MLPAALRSGCFGSLTTTAATSLSAALQHVAGNATAAGAAPAPDTMEVFVNGQSVVIPKGASVLAACEAAGIDIPRFCYHPRLSIAGNCRMCLVEVEKVPKPVASCAMPAAPNMNIKTETPMVRKAREGVMEFLLINHPLDCPICDQGGECDLQDLSMHYGSDRGRFVETKRVTNDKYLGPLVKTVMTRCIHCTRCVRFAKEIAGVEDLGVTGRGRDSEIGTYVDKLMTSELSGNVIDICPVGALTSKPAAFTSRSWELKATESIDVSDGLGANIRVDSRGTEIMRILPRLNENVNEEWISDKARFQFDGLKRQRLTVPYVKGPNGLEPANWKAALMAVKDGLSRAQPNEIAAIAGKLADAESMIALKDLINRLGSGNTRHEAWVEDMHADVRSNYIANTTVMGIESADSILLIGTNPRLEAPVYNARIRKQYLNGVKIGLVGEPVDLTYPYHHMGEGLAALRSMLKGGAALDSLKNAKRPMVIVGPAVFKRDDAGEVLKAIHDLVEKAGVVKEGWNGYNVLQESASSTAALDIGFVPSPSASSQPPKFVYLLQADDFNAADIPDDAFVVYQGSHGDRGAQRADVILPGAAYTEKDATYVNFEGRVQRTRAAVASVGDARDDWKIVRAVSEIVGATLPYDTMEAVRERLADVAPHLARFTAVEPALWLNGEFFKAIQNNAAKKADEKSPFTSTIPSPQYFYMTDAISRASKTMAKCTQMRMQANP